MNLLHRDPNVIAADADGQPLLLHVTNWTYLSFNEVGGRIWQHLAEPRSRDELLGLLASEFDAPGAQIGADLDTFVSVLKAKGFLAA